MCCLALCRQCLPVVETSRSGMRGRAFVQVLVLIRSGDAQELTTSNEQRLFQELQTSKRMVQEQVLPFSWHGFCHKLPTYPAPCVFEILVGPIGVAYFICMRPVKALLARLQCTCCISKSVCLSLPVAASPVMACFEKVPLHALTGMFMTSSNCRWLYTTKLLDARQPSIR